MKGGEKEFKISGMESRKLENIMSELEKCVLLCGNSHREVHALREELKSSSFVITKAILEEVLSIDKKFSRR